MPIQIIDNRQLSVDENLWLKCLSRRLDHSTVIRVGDEADRKPKETRIRAYLNVVMHANHNAVEEAVKMRKAKSLNEVLIRTGLAAEWEAQGEARGEQKTQKYVLDLINQGLTTDELKQRLEKKAAEQTKAPHPQQVKN